MNVFMGENEKMVLGDAEGGEEQRVAELQRLLEKNELFFTAPMRQEVQEKVREHLGKYLRRKQAGENGTSSHSHV